MEIQSQLIERTDGDPILFDVEPNLTDSKKQWGTSLNRLKAPITNRFELLPKTDGKHT